MKKNINIYIITECPYSGMFRSIIETSKLLKELKFNIIYILPSKSRDRYGEKSSKNEIELGFYGKIIKMPLRRRYRFIYSDKKKIEIFFEGKTDIVMSFGGYAGKICRILYRKGKIKTLYHVPQCIDIIRRNICTRVIEYCFEKFLSKQVKYYISCGSSECDILINKYNIDREKILFLPNSINRHQMVKNYDYKCEFVYVGRLSKDKGISRILKIFSDLDFLDKIMVVGDGNEMETLRKLYPSVNFIGNISNDKIYDILSKSRFFISYSIIEGLSYSLLEAMSAGTVPIISNVQGNKDVVLNLYNGFLFNNKSELLDLLFKSQLISDDYYDYLSSNAISTSGNLYKFSSKLFINHFKQYGKK